MSGNVDNSVLISGKEALIALANGEDIEFFHIAHEVWMDVKDFNTSIFFSEYEFRLKPRTITINGIEVPAPFEPNSVDHFYYIDSSVEKGYSFKNWVSDHSKIYSMYGAWRTEKEIKQVVAALRKLFKP